MLQVGSAGAGLHAFSSVALAGGGVAGGGDSSLFSDLVSAMGAEASGAYGGAVPVSAAIPLHAPGGAAQQGEASLSPLGVTHLPGMPPAFPTPYGSALATAPDDGPILQLAELAAAESWTVMSSQGNMHVSWRQRGGRLLWRAVAEGVPAMPAMVAAAVRHTLGQWGEELVSRSLSALEEFKAQELANTIWAVATSAVRHEALALRVSRQAVETLAEFRTQNRSPPLPRKNASPAVAP